MRRKQPRQAARALLARMGVEEPPIDVIRAASVLSTNVVARKFPTETSGMLLRMEDVTLIGVNANHPEVRRRFSIAHELGHLLLHPGRPLLLHETVRVNFRDDISSQATNIEEIEANAFAAELLMPEEMVVSVVESAAEDDVDRGDLINHLASCFAVSRQAMEIRLVNLGMIQPA